MPCVSLYTGVCVCVCVCGTHVCGFPMCVYTCVVHLCVFTCMGGYTRVRAHTCVRHARMPVHTWHAGCRMQSRRPSGGCHRCGLSGCVGGHSDSCNQTSRNRSTAEWVCAPRSPAVSGQNRLPRPDFLQNLPEFRAATGQGCGRAGPAIPARALSWTGRGGEARGGG